MDGTKTYKVRERELPVNVKQFIVPTYKDLTKPKFLTHGKTQNATKNCNGMIWERLPKIKYRAKLKLGVFDAVANFNYGEKSINGHF